MGGGGLTPTDAMAHAMRISLGGLPLDGTVTTDMEGSWMSQRIEGEPTADAPEGDDDSESGMEWLSIGIGAGLSLGVAIGILMGNIGAGIGLGLSLGVAVGLVMKNRQEAGRDEDEPAQ